jgi:hypothetical protein
MTFTTDPPSVGDISLIPNADEKADLNAPSGSGGKLVIGQAPNITITETSVVADAAERLALDVQEGDVAIQTNVSSSFIFTGGDNVAPNWKIIDFDAVGAISGEDISPNNITALGQLSGQSLSVTGTINGADTSAAAAGEALASDGNGGFTFASVGGDLLSIINDFLSQSNMAQIASSQSDMQEVINSPTVLSEVAASQTAMQEVAASQTAMQEVAASQIAMQEVGKSNIAQNEITSSNTAVNALNAATVNGSQSPNDGSLREINDLSVSDVSVYVKSIDAPRGSNVTCDNVLIVNPSGPNFDQRSDINVTIEDFVTSVLHGQCANFTISGPSTTYEFIPV